MRNLFLTSLLLGVMLGCGSEKNKEEKLDLDPASLQGTWQLVKYINHAEGETEWSTYSNDIIYQKHITPTHFTWLKYEKSKDNLDGIGGGTYTFDGQTYTEDIAFFLPPGSSELGQAIPFEVKFEEGQWYHLGYAKVYELDAESGDMVVTDSVRIEEIWERVENGPSAQDVMGTWNLKSYREQEDSTRSEYPPFVKYIKSITPSHFIWVKYNGEGDEVMAAGSGTYTYSSGKYAEQINMLYPPGAAALNTSPAFDAAIENSEWSHIGYIKRSDSVAIDSMLIDEVWVK